MNGTQKFSDIDYIVLTFPDGKKAKLKFLDLKTDITLGDDRFNFVVPQNTKKIN
jgi:outer membrane lipoprotein-sorting protein